MPERGIGREPVVKFIRRAPERGRIVAVDADINIDAINLVEFTDGVFVLINDPVPLRQGGKDVFLQADAGGNRDAGS